MAENRSLQLILELQDNASADLKKAMGGISSNMERATELSKKFATALGAGLLAAGGAAVAFGTSSLKSFSEVGDAVEKMSARTGVAAESISALRVAADLSGTSIESVEKGMTTYVRTASAAIEDTERFKETFGRLGFSMDQVKKLQPDEAFQKIGFAISEISDPMERTRLAMDIFGKSGTELIPLFGSMEDGLTPFVEEAKRLGVAFDDVSAKKAADLNDQLGALSTSFDGLKLTVGNAIAPIAGPLIESIANTIAQLTQWADSIGGVEGALQSLEFFLSQHYAAISVAAGAVVGLLIPALYAWVTAMFAVIPSLIASAVALAPFLIGGAIIGGVVAGVLWLVQNWELVGTKASEIWGGIANFFSGIWESMTGAIKVAWEGIKSFFTAVWDAISKVFEFALSFIVGLVIGEFDKMGIDIVAVFKTIQEFIQIAWDAISMVFSSAFEYISGAWTAFWEGLKGILGGAWEGIKGGVSAGWGWLTNKFNESTGPVKSAWGKMWEGLTLTVGTAWEAVKSVVKSSINWIIEKINSLIDSINSVAAKGAGTLGIEAKQIPRVPMLAKGGIVTKPTLAMIGEDGAEAVIPLNRKNNPAGVGMGGGIYVTVTGNNISNSLDLNDVADQVGEAIMNKLRLNTRLAL